MGYVAVKGGLAAIEASIQRLRYERLKGRKVIEVETIKNTLRGLINRIMSEGSLYSRDLAALAIKQGEGNPEEATFLLRAYRSTLPRKYYSRVVLTKFMRFERRISAAFKDIPGGQILGATYDYTHRLLDFSLYEEKPADIEKWLEEFENNCPYQGESPLSSLPKVVDYLRKEGLMAKIKEDDTEPLDVTRKSLEFPADRSERLQTLTRGETGAVTALGYAAIRGYGILHPTVGELRVGCVPVFIDYPLDDSKSEEEALYIGEIQVTEVETLFPHIREKEYGAQDLEFFLGYGLCFGQNETKAIAMSVLDYCLEKGPAGTPVSDEEFVLMHIDSVEATGFVSHLKLPHYVTFQSKLDRVRKTRKGEKGE
ncbi:carbon-phosphorus lyase [Thermanaerosceptrum fracticalcis]|uniref:Carbon-phosphorus lyase n=1 Tax=Thermanaerosceptrum fracticalcis TaxID=1712410 RepID=A0A7G6DYS7_THEFR|nr:carbon-phosphorus lyase complex subunit PhnI [Thermanaerosceptrum fracticalcis]QNB44981.1 carbon-phosphorus lyase [Thermanaerosceptrum fracticalcis]